MKEYIDREAAMETIKNHKRKSKVVYSIEEALYCVGQEIGEAIRSVPAADVVEVVRCKDCVCGYKMQNGQIICKFLESGNFIPYVKPNDYCSYGERKEEWPCP